MSRPELRSAPPWVMEEMMAREPALPDALLRPSPAVRAVAERLRAAADAGAPVVTTGCGTSEHAAMGAAVLLSRALGAPVHARQALEAAEAPWTGGCLVAFSHEGGTRATALAVAAARGAGARTVLVTARPEAAPGLADAVLPTPELDRSWCHTVAYVSGLLAAAAVARDVGLGGVEAGAAADVLGRGLAAVPAGFVDALDGRTTMLTAGAGADHVTSRELALKLCEGARVAAGALELETALHGHLAGHDDRSALVVVASPAASERVARRAAMLEAAARAIGMPVTRLAVVEPPPALDPALGALLAGAAALQVATLALAAARGVNPDLIRRDQAPYAAAAAAAEDQGDW